jgi:hypothetical protein
MPATLVVVSERGHGALFGNGLVEGAFAPRPWLSLAVGAAARTQWVPRAVLSALAARVAARLATRSGWHFGVAADVPFAGDDRTDLTGTIFVGWLPPEPR